MKDITTDITIIGGGIAGLWLLNVLKGKGYSVVLLEKEALGAGQTIKSQGIIHGGMKYALAGSTSSAQAALSDMPSRWQQCLQGQGEIDLRDVEVLSDSQYMWSTNKLTGAVSTLFASKSLQSHISAEEKGSWPEIIKNSNINSKLYKLSEIVLNVPTLIKALASPHLEHCLQLEYTNDIEIDAQKIIHVAGKNNKAENLQLRPLHMVMVKSRKLTKLYGHCISLSTVPRITISTHIAKDGIPIWYLGGKLAEDGANLDSDHLIAKAKKELSDIFPQLDLINAQWASFFVDRAEAKQKGNAKPDSATVFNDQKNIIAWPTKLALAPVLADKIYEILQKENIQPKHPTPDLTEYTKAQIATPIWDQML